MAHVRKDMISFFLTTRCNLDCSYCYTNKRKGPHQRLSEDFAFAGLEDYFQNNSSRHIRFFGAGEPTREISLMRSIRDRAAQIAGTSLIVETQTNGVFPRSTAEWLAQNVNIVWVSSDGLPEMQDKYRRTLGNQPTSKEVAKNVRYLTDHTKGMVGIRTTITADNVRFQKDILEYFASLGVRAVYSDPIFPPVGQRELSDAPDLMEYAREFVEAESYARENGIFYGSILTCNFDEDTSYNCRACLPAPHLTTDGFVSACDMALFGNDIGPMSAFVYGKWVPESGSIFYDEAKIKILRQRTAQSLSQCRNCAVQLRCAGYCLGEVTNETGSMCGQKPQSCDAIRYLWQNLPRATRVWPYLHP
jgi:radical SAM protein with 4Fe4S-binding SPASM domain